MNFSRRLALIVLIVAMLVILAVGFIRATVHDEDRPDMGPATSASAQQPG